MSGARKRLSDKLLIEDIAMGANKGGICFWEYPQSMDFWHNTLAQAGADDKRKNNGSQTKEHSCLPSC